MLTNLNYILIPSPNYLIINCVMLQMIMFFQILKKVFISNQRLALYHCDYIYKKVKFCLKPWVINLLVKQLLYQFANPYMIRLSNAWESGFSKLIRLIRLNPMYLVSMVLNILLLGLNPQK
jgi:hypothetical protein